MSAKVSSRLARKQQRKLVRQTIWSIIGGGLLLLVFLFWVLPNSVRLLSGVLDTTFEEKDEIPPQVPIFSQPATATNLSPYLLKGFAEPGSKVFVSVNGNENEVVTGDDGVFEAELGLTEGENVFSAVSEDAAGNRSRETEAYQIDLDSQLPSLAIDNISDGQEFIGKDQQQLTIAGITDPSARVYINQRLVLARTDGSFKFTLRLNEGENKLTFKVIDKAGNEAEFEYTVFFKL